MKSQARSLPIGTPPAWIIELYRDPAGNWFAGAEIRRRPAMWQFYSATYTTAREAVEEMLQQIEQEDGAIHQHAENGKLD